jgi:hypothetical protein
MKHLSKEAKDLLLKECALSSMNLGVGLTFLRRYDFASLGFIYQAFFSLSIGIERLIKTILLYEYLYEHNGGYPPHKYLKSKGHDLSELFKEVEKLAQKYGCEAVFDKINQDPIFSIIIGNLSDFAKANRYFNLDKLSGSSTTQDPVSRWDKEVNSIILNRHFKYDHPKNQRVREMAKRMQSFVILRHRDESSKDMTYNEVVDASLTIPAKQKYGMYYTFCIIKALCVLQQEQSYKSATDIALHEFFMVFRRDHKDAIRIKTWNPHPPYRF